MLLERAEDVQDELLERMEEVPRTVEVVHPVAQVFGPEEVLLVRAEEEVVLALEPYLSDQKEEAL